MEEYRVIVDNISKRFRRDYSKKDGALFKILNFRKRKDEFDVLKNISFKIKPGENIGLIGKNSSGKSTLLRILAGIYNTDKGSIKIKGNVVYLAGFDHGLQGRLTMRENIYLLGVLRGLSKKEIDKKFNEIVDFSGLREYLDAKVYQFSSGMVNRLSFSITFFSISHKNPDVLLIDEALGAGADIEFKQKAIKKMEELIKGGASVIIASHDLELIKKYCDRTLLIDNGKIFFGGNNDEAIYNYLNLIHK